MSFILGMKGLGTIVNVIAVALGGIIGVFAGGKLKKSLQDSLLKVLGLAVIFIGIGCTLSRMLILDENGKITTYGTMMMIICLVLGTIVGEIINIEYLLEKFGDWLKKKVNAKNDNRFVDSFVSASLVVCIGAMAIVGAIEDGMTGNHTTLFAKSLLDFVCMIVMASSMGIGAVFAFIPVGLLQGGVTVFARLISSYITSLLVADLSLVGSVMIFAVGVNVAFGKKFKVANMLPALIFVVIYSLLGINL